MNIPFFWAFSSFDKSVLAIQWVEATDCKEKDETYSCISSTDSKQTFASVGKQNIYIKYLL